MATSPQTAQALAEAIDLHRLGRLAEAESRYRKILRKEPANATAAQMAGMLRLQAGDTAEGVVLLRRALVLRPNSAEILANLGIALRALGRYDEALSYLTQAIDVAPTLPLLHFERGAALQATARHEEAATAFDDALKLQPDNWEAWYLRGLSLHASGRSTEAVESYGHALAGLPDDAEVHYNLAVALQAIGRPADALASYDRALARNPDFPAALNNRGNLLVELGRADEGREDLERTIGLDSGFTEAHNNLALALQALGRREEAVARLDQALARNPDYVEALLNRGGLLLSLNRLDEALASLTRARELAPDDPKVHNNLGLALNAAHRFDEALACYGKALSLDPGYAEARFHRGLTELIRGNFEQGWQDYEARWAVKNAPPRRFSEPAWDGNAPLAGERLLLWCEQGLGDAVQFCRYVPLLAARGIRIALEVPPELRALATSLAGVEILVSRGDPLPAFDAHCSLLSLPRACGTRAEDIPGTVPYLAADAQKTAEWDNRLGAGFRVGIVCSGNPQHSNDANRSVPLAAFSWLQRDGVSLHLLQKECRPADAEYLASTPAIRDLRPFLGDLGDTAAAIAGLDLVVSVDTSIAHLAGALGKAVWILLPFSPDWRWLTDRQDTPWYPTARLFRQTVPGNWASAMTVAASALAATMQKR